MTWVLVLSIFQYANNSTPAVAVTTVLGYGSLEQCQAAGKDWTGENYQSLRWRCIRGPAINGYKGSL
jgi:NaMN:DMB phosphoribosyltransferase